MSLEIHWYIFGSWILQAVRGAESELASCSILSGSITKQGKDVGPEFVRITWDGKERFLSIDASPSGLYSGPAKWKSERSKRFNGKTDEELLSFVEGYLVKRLGRV